MNRSFEIKELASKLGLDVPNISDDSLILNYIARQIGLPDYFNTPNDMERLYSALSDIKERQGMDDFMGRGYNPDLPLEFPSEVVENPSTYPNTYANQQANQTPFSSHKELKKEEEKEENKESSKSSSKMEGKEEKKEEKGGQASQKETASTPQLPATTNGYNPYLLHQNNTPALPDFTQNANKNRQHTNQINNDNKESPSNKNNLPSKKENAKDTDAASKANKNEKQKGGGSNPLSTVRNAKNVIENPKEAAKQAVKKKVQDKAVAFLLAHPVVIVIFLVGALFSLILFTCLFAVSSDKSGRGGHGSNCTYHLSGVTSTGVSDLSNVKVELINCEGNKSAYRVLETVDFEKYVIGVALGEVGSGANEEVFKTQIVAARNFALTRNAAMCPSSPDNCFYGYNPSTNTIRMRACEADQVYVDMNRDTYIAMTGGNIHRFSPEVNSGTLYKARLSDSEKQRINALGEEVKGKVLLDSSGNVMYTNYINTDQNAWADLASRGMNYEQILDAHYGGNGMSDAVCTSYAGEIDYGDYVLDSNGHTILHQSLDTFLQSKGTSLQEFNSLIAYNVQENGYGTRAGVVTAAVTLIAELGNNYGVKVPYFWGGGHGTISNGAANNWGSSMCYTYANNQSYNYCGLDCSGFVPWAVYNGGFNASPSLAGSFKNWSGTKQVTLSSSAAVLEPGDLLESDHHIVLVVGIDENTKQYICAEASGNQEGVLFTRRSFGSSGYWGVKMDGYYETHVRQEK